MAFVRYYEPVIEGGGSAMGFMFPAMSFEVILIDVDTSI